jgi:hypothetical protein
MLLGGAEPSALQTRHEFPGNRLLQKLKINMRGVRFCTLGELYASVTRRVRQLNCSTDLTGIMDLPKRWDAFIRQKGDSTEEL